MNQFYVSGLQARHLRRTNTNLRRPRRRWRLRRAYAALFVILLAIEVMIARYVHGGLVGGFVRGFAGDSLVVVLLCALMRAVTDVPASRVPWVAMAVACAMEVLQAFWLVQLLGLADQTPIYTVLRVALGATFDWWDFVAYGCGFALWRVVAGSGCAVTNHVRIAVCPVRLP